MILKTSLIFNYDILGISLMFKHMYDFEKNVLVLDARIDMILNCKLCLVTMGAIFEWSQYSVSHNTNLSIPTELMTICEQSYLRNCSTSLVHSCVMHRFMAVLTRFYHKPKACRNHHWQILQETLKLIFKRDGCSSIYYSHNWLMIISTFYCYLYVRHSLFPCLVECDFYNNPSDPHILGWRDASKGGKWLSY